ncbi:GNAT family N-acetyltransferase [Enterobacter cloacae]|uniref:GNAT family N-acetyltransferase n=1 Tax=Enterobacter cloacae TaxID=550 RepID=UPI001FF4084C|nr:GNAT family N-acetyltransferase [Enterobacter cloacae]UOZ01522.1 GNAT family N-acetyltransferase [Enterobacter cloacae subsp. cloacae]
MNASERIRWLDILDSGRKSYSGLSDLRCWAFFFNLNLNVEKVVMNHCGADIHFKVSSTPDQDPNAINIINKLNGILSMITGNDGAANIRLTDFEHTRALFILAWRNDQVIGCGGFRPFAADTAELKRMFVAESRQGTGVALLKELEKQARAMHYKKIILETRCVNKIAVNFYLKNGYQYIENYGVYKGREDAVCFAKALTSI